MIKKQRINSTFTSNHGQSQRGNRLRLPLCSATGLARYRDRHQARDGAIACAKTEQQSKTSTFACGECQGFHLETIHPSLPPLVVKNVEPTEVFTCTLSSRKRRYMLVDIENLTGGAKYSPMDVVKLWQVIREQGPGIAPLDHVVVGASRRVSRKYRHCVSGSNVKWVIGPDAPDGADHALLAAIDLRRVSADYDELLIMSGDHAFTELAHRARKVGLSVHVVTVDPGPGRTVLSQSLKSASNIHTVVRLQSRDRELRNLESLRAVAVATQQTVKRVA